MATEKYTASLPRVSQIVEFAYPFAWYAKDRFLQWLRDNQIELDEYMKEASEGWTFVHLSLEEYLDGKPFKWRKYKNLINAWIKFIKDTWIKKLATEHYIRTKDYQWTIDLIAERDWEVWILDWKTYWLAKAKFGLPNTYKKPYDKLKKARLQLSLYAYAMGITRIWVVELEEGWYHFHKLELMEIDEIKKVLDDYKFHYVDEL